MSVGLIALLDDIAALAKLAAASVDDVSAAAAKAGAKAAGVVIDDAAVTPRYVTGLSPQRELPIIWRIALGSIRNKLFILLPAALLLSAFAPWALTPLLMMGGAYLCFEGAEKILGKWLHHGEHSEEADTSADDPAHLEKTTIAGAVRTDLILSAEIMAIALATVADTPIWEQAIILIVVSLGITAGVYGVVALIVKLDDIGLHMVENGGTAAQSMGKGLVHAMPRILAALTVIGTAAMLWVGGGIIVHGLEELGVGFPGHQIEAISAQLGGHSEGLGALLGWAASAGLFAISGIIVGGALAMMITALKTLSRRKK